MQIIMSVYVFASMSAYIYMFVGMYMCMNMIVCIYSICMCVKTMYSAVRVPLVLKCAIQIRFIIITIIIIIIIITYNTEQQHR